MSKMNNKELVTALNYCDPTDYIHGFYVRERARDRKMTVEITRNANGTFVINSGKMNYTVGGQQRQVTMNVRKLTKELADSFEAGDVRTH